MDQENRIVALNALAVELFQLDRGDGARESLRSGLSSTQLFGAGHPGHAGGLEDRCEHRRAPVLYDLCVRGALRYHHRIVRFRDVNRAQANDSNMRRLLYQKHKGHVAKYHFENLCMADSAMQKVVGTARAWPPRITPSSSPARAAPERSCWPPPSTMRPHGQTALRGRQLCGHSGKSHRERTLRL